ncbi:MAG: GTP cyclohydrolase I, partial [Chloroflexota bacterium]
MNNKDEVYKVSQLITDSDIDTKAIENAIKSLLSATGEDASREGLLNTPKRVGKMNGELLAGYR